MTSPYLNLRTRPLSEVERERAMQGGCNGDATTDAADELEFLANKVEELRQRFGRSHFQCYPVKDGVAVLSDLAADLFGTARDIMERERNNR